ncbi:MAG: M23 family metallopeptidase [Deltaproteobacteria bacterium]|nr:M23 family metallopeptidase [Deltaproteobacteria bacterium]
MINRRYFLVILDSTGRSVRRVSIAVSTLLTASIITLISFVFILLISLSSILNNNAAKESAEIEHENKILNLVLHQIQERLPKSRFIALKTNLTFAQIWSKSGLNSKTDIFGIGPLDDDATINSLNDNSLPFSLHHNNNQLLKLPYIALPLAFEQLDSEGLELQTSLGELLEYFHDANQLLSNTPSLSPVVKGFITSYFGKRLDPISNNRWVMHKGIDIGGRIGTDVIAPADGVAIFTGRRGGYGLTLVIDHGYAIQTHYAHLSKIYIKPGDHIKRGETIAAVGNSGRSTGPHLHYEVRRDGRPLQPLHFVLD